MAEVVGTVSAITSFVTLAFQSTVTLYETLQSLQSRDKVIRELRQEIEALQGVLQALGESSFIFDVDIAALKQPLIRCNNACGEFNSLIGKCTSHSTEVRSKRDWLKLRYMGDDIAGFRDMLANYKSTVSIALEYANLRATKTTKAILKEYKELIENTKCDLENHLQDIRERLQSARTQGPTVSGIDIAELLIMEDEKTSTQKSLEICEQYLILVGQSQPSLLGEMGQVSRPSDNASSLLNPKLPWLINTEGCPNSTLSLTPMLTTTTNPYEANPAKIPTTDIYADVPFYGRYYPKNDDFHVDFQHVNSQNTDSLRYWTSVVRLCTEEIRIYPADEGGRDVFALGSVIVKSSHLHAREGTQCTEIDYSYADANEIRAIALAKTVLNDVKVPEIYFASKVNGRQVLVQERLPGVGLSVAWPYLSSEQRNSYKEQARKILHKLHSIKPAGKLQARSHVVPDPNILTNGRINPLEGEILFSDSNHDPDMSFMHNDVTESNCIVNDGKIVGLIDWEMAGFFGWKTAGEVHRRIRTPQREHFMNANLSEEKLQDIMFWKDLYDKDAPEN